MSIDVSAARNEFNASIITAANVKFPLRTECTYQAFHTQPVDSPRAVQQFRGKHQDSERRKMVFYCNDFQRTDDGFKEVVGSCTIPPNADLVERVRPLGAVAAVMLVVAAVVAVVRADTRHSAHGRALVCHALCLAAANALQTVWYFTTERGNTYCRYYMYFTYFFMIAANFWLSAITLNMAYGFRQPLGAQARSAGASGVWRRFGVMAAFAWGASVALAAGAVVAHSLQESADALGLLTPSFFETRTCGFEDAFPGDNRDDSIKFRATVFLGKRLGTLCYYYAPVALLVVVNGVCVFLTICSVRSLRRDAAILYRDSPSKQQSILRSALLYAKLLLSAGILELVVEGLTWAVGRPQQVALNYGFSLTYSFENANQFAIAVTFLDLARAAAVLWLCCGDGLGAACGVVTRWLVATWVNIRKMMATRVSDLQTDPRNSASVATEHTASTTEMTPL